MKDKKKGTQPETQNKPDFIVEDTILFGNDDAALEDELNRSATDDTYFGSADF